MAGSVENFERAARETNRGTPVAWKTTNVGQLNGEGFDRVSVIPGEKRIRIASPYGTYYLPEGTPLIRTQTSVIAVRDRRRDGDAITDLEFGLNELRNPEPSKG